jgi:sugar fermentation stimulation protein A
MKGPKYFEPNKSMDPGFADAVELAKKSGVLILAYDSIITPNTIYIGNRVKN